MSELAARPVPRDPYVAKERPLRHWSTLLAFMAAMLLVIAGGPTVAKEAVCDPCPPDCPMMFPDAGAADHGPAKPMDQKGKAPCEQTVVCQPAVSAAPAPVAVKMAPPLFKSAALRWTDSPEAPSRPPDRSLRPPIHI